MVGGKVTSDEFCVQDQLYQQFLCSFENVESYVEKFLLIKDIEQQLTDLNYSYFVKFMGDKAIFWCQPQNKKQWASRRQNFLDFYRFFYSFKP